MLKHLKCLLSALLLLFCSASVLADIRIHGLSDIRLGRWVLGAGPLRADTNICVTVRPPGSPLYQVTAYGQGSGNAFVLSSAGYNLPFRMFFNDRPRPNGATELVPGQALVGLRARRRGTNRIQCNRPNANISILVSDSDLAEMPAGRYSGTIVFVVGPE